MQPITGTRSTPTDIIGIDMDDIHSPRLPPSRKHAAPPPLAVTNLVRGQPIIYVFGVLYQSLPSTGSRT
ncbi:hypothetical protein CS8_030380 [Cupriavidus sp. 8B]